MASEKWTWLPHPAHFIGADKCLFRLATVVANGNFIVSTVGEYSPYDSLPYRDIGSGRLYETMVFKAKESEEECCVFEVADYTELDMYPANDPGEARRNHMRACEKWSRE